MSTGSTLGGAFCAKGFDGGLDRVPIAIHAGAELKRRSRGVSSVSITVNSLRRWFRDVPLDSVIGVDFELVA